jgi:molecular chaperone DnaK
MNNLSILAIDFGTTNSYFCKCPADQISPVGVDFGSGRDGIPTAILYRGDKEPLIGNLALHEFGEASNEERKTYRLCTQFKPDIAVSEQSAVNAKDFLRMILIQSQQQHIMLDPDQHEVIIGVPSEAEDNFRAKLKEVTRAAGYGDVKLVDEPKGALLCHLWHKDFSPDEARKGILVVDFGGGTCDFAFLRCLEVCHSWGDMHLGGRLFDDLFFQWFLDQNPSVLPEIEQAGDTYYVHSYLCRKAKEFFSLTMTRGRSESVNKSVGRYGSIKGMNWDTFLDKAKTYVPSRTFADYLRKADLKPDRLFQQAEPIDLIRWFRQTLTGGLAQKAIDTSDISRVILAGGSSQWPFVCDVISEALHLDPSTLMRSDRPYAAISEGLAILPALQRQFEETRKKLRDELPQFCDTKVRPLIGRITDVYVSDVASDITLELFDKQIKPLLHEFRENGGSAASLKMNMSLKAKLFEPQLRMIIEARMQTLRMGLPGQVMDLLAKWFKSHGLSAGDAQIEERKKFSAMSDAFGPEVPDLYGSIMDTVGWFVVAIATSIGAMICGGAGMAILVSGPVGLVAGAVLSSVIALLTIRYGKEKALRFTDNWAAPPWLSKMLLTRQKIAGTRREFRLQLENQLRKETLILQDEFKTRIYKITELQIEGLSEIAQL